MFNLFLNDIQGGYELAKGAYPQHGNAGVLRESLEVGQDSKVEPKDEIHAGDFLTLVKGRSHITGLVRRENLGEERSELYNEKAKERHYDGLGPMERKEAS